MKDRILLSAEELQEAPGEEGILVVDCRFALDNTSKGREQWLKYRIPGARYAHLDDDLSSPIKPHTGRHPLPATDDFARFLSRIGWREGQLLVAYDEGSSAYASRLWWLMRYHGKPAAMIDGGLAAWLRADGDLESGHADFETSPVPVLRGDAKMAAQTAVVSAALGDVLVLDARAPERFSGQVEPLDTIGGHIPGAVNHPYESNLAADGRFKPAEDLRSAFSEVLGDTSAESVVHSCGSGVTACHNLFAMELAGLVGSRLYPGSWSEWIRNPDRPIATGC